MDGNQNWGVCVGDGYIWCIDGIVNVLMIINIEFGDLWIFIGLIYCLQNGVVFVELESMYI